jgi:hypothetical protein
MFGQTGLLKQEYQRWMRSYNYSHCVVVQPTPRQWISGDEINQRLRTINFKINKYFLKPSFGKWKNEDKFWWIGFTEGERILRNIHYHFLLYSPQKVYRNQQNFTVDGVTDVIQNEWCKLSSIYGDTFEERYDLDEVLHITENTNNNSSIFYSSKKFNPRSDKDNLIFIPNR